MPKWLEPEAKKEWRRLARQLEQIGVLTEVDQAAFASYCQAYARWKEAEEFITQHGTIVRTPSGYWQQVRRCPLPNLSEDHEQDRGAVRPDAVLPVPIIAGAGDGRDSIG
jgi:P27 family predicted phage terminase small subunit